MDAVFSCTSATDSRKTDLLLWGGLSHFEGWEPRLHGLQNVGQEVDGARHACRQEVTPWGYRYYDEFQSQKHIFTNTGLFITLCHMVINYLQKGRRECPEFGSHVGRSSCTSRQTAKRERERGSVTIRVLVCLWRTASNVNNCSNLCSSQWNPSICGGIRFWPQCHRDAAGACNRA